MFGWFLHSLHHQHHQHHTTTQNTNNNLCNEIFSCLFLHGFCSGLQHAERNRYSRFCWGRLSRGWLVGWNLFELFLNSSDEKCNENMDMFGWFHHSLHHSLHHQHHQHHATIQNTNNNLCNEIFPMFVLAWVLFWNTTCRKKQVQWILLAKAFSRGWLVR